MLTYISRVRLLTASAVLTAATPAVAFAQGTPTTYTGLVQLIIEIINIIIPVIFGGLFIYFIWKVIDSWVLNAGDETKREEGKRYVTAAVIAFVVMISAWGIVALIKQSLFGYV